LPATPPETIGFPQIARGAGTICSGTVTAVARRPATHGQTVETVAITFHVENAIRGAIPGESLTISQWIGLWLGSQRYYVGERVFLFPYPPSKLGLTSTVGGTMGRFAVDPRGRILLSAQHGKLNPHNVRIYLHFILVRISETCRDIMKNCPASRPQCPLRGWKLPWQRPSIRPARESPSSKH
jgi:hypothetical protein